MTDGEAPKPDAQDEVKRLRAVIWHAQLALTTLAPFKGPNDLAHRTGHSLRQQTLKRCREITEGRS